MFRRLCNEESPSCNYIVKDHDYNMRYYLVDDIYTQWATFLKTITESQGNKQRQFAKRPAHAGVRRDEEEERAKGRHAGVQSGSKDLKMVGASDSSKKDGSASKKEMATGVSKDLKGGTASKKEMLRLGSNVLKRKSKDTCSSDSKKMATSKDFNRKTMKNSAVTRA